MTEVEKHQINLLEVLQQLVHCRITTDQVFFRDDEEVRSGGFGEVRVATLGSADSPTLVAVKTLCQQGTKLQRARVAVRLAREVCIMSKLSHPHILPLIGFSLDDAMLQTAWVMSPYLAKGNIKEYLEENEVCKQKRIELALDTGRGLHYLHSQDPSICHADIKPGNVLINDDIRAVICNFGISRVMSETQGFTTSKAIKGSTIYMSPELFTEENPVHTLKSDVWAWGCLVLEITTGRVLYQGSNSPVAVIAKISQGISPAPSDYVMKEIPSLAPLLEMCWKHSAILRPHTGLCVATLVSSQPEKEQSPALAVQNSPATKTSVDSSESEACSINTNSSCVKPEPIVQMHNLSSSPSAMDCFAPPDSIRMSSSSPSSTSSSFDSAVLNTTGPFSLFGNDYQPHHNASWSFDGSSSLAYSGALFGSPHPATQQTVEAAVHQGPSLPVVQMPQPSLWSSFAYHPYGPVLSVPSALLAPRRASSSPPLIGGGGPAPFQPPPVLANAFPSQPPVQALPAIPPPRRSFPCPHPGCGMKFRKRNGLVQHMRSHTGERPEVCDWCCRAFSFKSNLRRHYRTCKKKNAFEAAAMAAKEEPFSSPLPPFEQSSGPGASSSSTTVVPTSHDSPPCEHVRSSTQSQGSLFSLFVALGHVLACLLPFGVNPTPRRPPLGFSTFVLALRTVVDVEWNLRQLVDENGVEWLGVKKTPDVFSKKSAFKLVQANTPAFFALSEPSTNAPLVLHSKPVLDVPDLIHTLFDRVNSGTVEVATCTLCFESAPHDKLRPACGRSGCAHRLDEDCLKSWYGANKAGHLLTAMQLLCPFCRRVPTGKTMAKYNPQAAALGGLKDAMEDREFYFAWCGECGFAKRALERACCDGDRLLNIRNFVCEECQAARGPRDVVAANPGETGPALQPSTGPRITPCPKCGVMVEKTFGCNHITCVCGTHFCHVCGIDGGEDIYDHMNEAHGGIYDVDGDDDDDDGYNSE